MVFNILRNATIRNDTSCRHDNNDGWAVVWDENDDFRQYEETAGTTARLVWDGSYVFATTSGSAYVGPFTDQTPFDALIYSIIKVNLRIEPNPQMVTLPATGRIQFQTDDDPVYDDEKIVDFPILPNNAYNEYTIDLSQVRKWTGNVTRLRIYPFIDGTSGSIIHLKSIKVQSPTIFTCDTGFKGTVCNRYSEYSHPCPWVGRGGSCQSSITSDGVDIFQGVNDKLIVNINGYGDQGITLAPTQGARLKDIAKDIEDKLSNVGIGGYAGCRVDENLGRLSIIADDTREAVSTVVVEDTPLARTLGFYDNSGPTFDSLPGEDSASRYEPAGTIPLSKSQISHLYKRDPSASDVGIDLDVSSYSLKGGREDFALTSQEIKIDFENKTIIDFNNPINNSGVLISVAYSGDGGSNTEMRIFRPKSDGSIVHIVSIPMGIDDGEVDSVFEASTQIRVRKGDLLGIYDGRIDSGKTEEVHNRSYFIYDGNLTNGESINNPLPIEGRGERGIRLFAHGFDKQTEAILNIGFDQQELIEEIAVHAEEEVRVEEVNLTHAKSGGLNGGIHVTGDTGVDKFGDSAPSWVNLASLFDGIKFKTSGFTDARPAWIGTSFEPPDKYDQTEMSLTLDFAKGTPVFFDIDRVALYFRDPNNVKYFSVEYPITTDNSDNNQYWGPVATKYDQVYLQGKLLEPTDHPIYTNPIHPTIVNYIDSYQVLEYRVIDFRFDPIKARSIRYNIKNYFYEDDVSKETLSNFVLAPSPRIFEMEVFARSLPVASIADNFSFESSTDNSKYYLHSSSVSDGQTSARYLIGYPVQYIRAKIKPQGKMVVRSFSVSTSQYRTKIKSGFDDSYSLDIPIDDFESTGKITVLNDTEEAFNYFINISAQRNVVERCILWNRLSNPETTSISEIGPSCIVRKREPYFPREYNYSFNAPSYVVDPFWLLNRSATSYISYDHGSSWSSRGTILTDYNESTFLDSVSPLADEFLFVYIVVDLGKVYSLDTVQAFDYLNRNTFDGPLYSNRDVSDPSLLNLVDDFTGVKEEARWLRFRSFSRTSGQINTAEAISYVQISLDPIDGRNKGKIPWVPAPLLTNYEFGSTSTSDCGEGWQCEEAGFNNWYAVDLQSNYNITNIVLGPTNTNFGSQDLDSLEPGGAGSSYTTSSRSNSNIAYSSSNVSDPVKVVWGSLNTSPGSSKRWILLRRSSNIIDEVLVHINDNEQESKPAFNESRWWSAKYNSVVKDRQEFMEGTHSISITYNKNKGGALEEMLFEQSLGIDHELAKRDQLKLLFYVTDSSQLDFSKGYIALGRNTSETNTGRRPLEGESKDEINYFSWPLSDLQSLIHSGWNELFLPFTNNFRVGRPYFEEDDVINLSSGDASGRSRMRWFKVAFAGIPNNNEFDVKVNGFEIVRADYIPGKFGNSLYLSGNEYAKFSLHNFNILEGSIDFFINTDWTKDAGCNSCDDSRDHTIFRFFNNDGYVLGLFMTGYGMRVYLSDGLHHFFLTDNGPKVIRPGSSIHVALSWDLLGRKSIDALKLYVDGVLSSSFLAEALQESLFKPNADATLIFGGYAWDGVTGRRTSSVDGSIENVKLFNYSKTDYSFDLVSPGIEHIRPPDDLLEISVDGVNFFGSQNRGDGLPILIRNVSPGESFDVFIRRKEDSQGFPEKGQERMSYIEVLRTIAG